MDPSTEAKRPAQAANPKQAEAEQKPSTIEADMESAAAEAEPMGSIAAAVPGSNAAAQDTIKTGRRPGAEAPEIRNEPETTAGTEVKVQGEEPDPE